MVKFLLVFFVFMPSGVGAIKEPMKTIEECRAKADQIVSLAKESNVTAVGACISPEDYLAAD